MLANRAFAGAEGSVIVHKQRARLKQAGFISRSGQRSGSAGSVRTNWPPPNPHRLPAAGGERAAERRSSGAEDNKLLTHSLTDDGEDVCSCRESRENSSVLHVKTEALMHESLSRRRLQHDYYLHKERLFCASALLSVCWFVGRIKKKTTEQIFMKLTQTKCLHPEHTLLMFGADQNKETDQEFISHFKVLFLIFFKLILREWSL